VVGDGAGEEGLASAGRTVEEDALGLGDAERVEELGVLHARSEMGTQAWRGRAP
jgi:hypothetical protein